MLLLLTKDTQSAFYSLTVPFYHGQPLDNMFTAVDPQLHRQLRSPTVQVFSMTNLRNYEQSVDDCTEILMRMLHEADGRALDYTEWFQWYAFDVISSITWQRRLGFLESRDDVLGMIRGQKFSSTYFAIVGQLPWLHPYLMGNRRLVKLLLKIFPDQPDPMGTLFTVSFVFLFLLL